MPTFFGRRYARGVERIGWGETAAGVVILLLTAGIWAAFGWQVSRERSSLFAVPEEQAGVPAGRPAVLRSAPAGWRAPAQVDRYGADELYMKIDGRADAFLERGCVELIFGVFVAADNPERTVDVYVFDMGAPARAAEIYRLEKPADVPAVAVGAEGYSAGSAVFFCLGAYYVQVLPGGAEPEDVEAARAIAASVAEELQPRAAPLRPSGEAGGRGARWRGGRGRE